jgi:hypothetical protein
MRARAARATPAGAAAEDPSSLVESREHGRLVRASQRRWRAGPAPAVRVAGPTLPSGYIRGPTSPSWFNYQAAPIITLARGSHLLQAPCGPRSGARCLRSPEGVVPIPKAPNARAPPVGHRVPGPHVMVLVPVSEGIRNFARRINEIGRAPTPPQLPRLIVVCLAAHHTRKQTNYY